MQRHVKQTEAGAKLDGQPAEPFVERPEDDAAAVDEPSKPKREPRASSWLPDAETQLSYATITAPISGHVGFRQVDASNIVHAGDQTPITVLTDLTPTMVVFTLPQRDLAAVQDAMAKGEVEVVAMDRGQRSGFPGLAVERAGADRRRARRRLSHPRHAL
jgi:multidrug resistance efflux pump